MKAIVFDDPGDESVLYLGEVEPPRLGESGIRIQIAATALNRADLLQRRGLYPPPAGASPILGLECAGTVIEVGDSVRGWSVGDRVMALLPGGGYAEEVVVDAGSAMKVPGTLTILEAGALPEVFLTAYLNLFEIGRAALGDSVLVHGGGSGVGTAAIQLCNLAKVRIFVTAGSDEKCRRCRELGADVAINYRTEQFEQLVRKHSAHGVDVILDPIGGGYLSRNLASLARGGRLVVIGSMGGGSDELDLGTLLGKRAQIIGSTLRSRTIEEKAAIVSSFLARFGADLDQGRIRPVIHETFPLAEAAAAHRMMRDSEHFGKIALHVG